MSSDRIEALSRRLADPTTRRGALGLLGLGVAGAAVTVVGLDEAEARRKAGKQRKARARRRRRNRGGENNVLANVPVTGTDEEGNEVFDGTLTVKKFVEGDDAIEALAQLEGTLTRNGKEHRVTRGVRVPVAILGGGDDGAVGAEQLECEILNLELGPIDLNLLGLEIHIDPIVILIEADPTGGLLGSLLCGLLGGGPLALLVRLLNDLLDILQGL
jgi:hypothetical protein